MFARFARRMTLLYTVVAASATALMLSLLALCALFGYVRLLDETAAQTAVHAYAFGASARQLGQPFTPAAIAFRREDAHSGIVTIAVPPGSRALGRGGASTPPEGANRVGVFVAELFGMHARRVEFDGGRILVIVNAAQMLSVLLFGGGAIVAAGLLAGLAAWFAGRYIAAEALRPLVEVTQALQRFAARDFTPEPIAVAGRSEFDAVAEAYNAAAVQVDAAFLEHERADERMRQFLADAGHELHRPLTIVLGYTEHVRNVTARAEPSLAVAFDGIAAEGSCMRALIDNLVLLARLDSEERGFVEPFALGELVEELTAARRSLYPQTEIRIELNENIQIFAARDDVREALGNVLDNALKYGAGTPVRIGLERVDETRVRLSVADSGPGIAPGTREAIFERFYRGEGPRSVAGSGLGLAIARRALQRAGGRIWLSEAPAGSPGAVFAFELPAGSPERPASQASYALTGSARE